LIWLLQNLLALLERSDSSALIGDFPRAPRLPANCTYIAGLAAARLGLLRLDSAPSDDLLMREVTTVIDIPSCEPNSKLSSEAQQLLRACAVDLCEQIVDALVQQQAAPDGCMDDITPSGVAACLEYLHVNAS